MWGVCGRGAAIGEGGPRWGARLPTPLPPPAKTGHARIKRDKTKCSHDERLLALHPPRPSRRGRRQPTAMVHRRGPTTPPTTAWVLAGRTALPPADPRSTSIGSGQGAPFVAAAAAVALAHDDHHTHPLLPSRQRAEGRRWVAGQGAGVDGGEVSVLWPPPPPRPRPRATPQVAHTPAGGVAASPCAGGATSPRARRSGQEVGGGQAGDAAAVNVKSTWTPPTAGHVTGGPHLPSSLRAGAEGPGPGAYLPNHHLGEGHVESPTTAPTNRHVCPKPKSTAACGAVPSGSTFPMPLPPQDTQTRGILPPRRLPFRPSPHPSSSTHAPPPARVCPVSFRVLSYQMGVQHRGRASECRRCCGRLRRRRVTGAAVGLASTR